MKSNYEEKKQARIERYKALAGKNEQASQEHVEKAFKMAKVIPPGQPILIGHHSEKGDRRYRAKIDNVHRKGLALEQKAQWYTEKAAAAEANTAISSDDPQAIEKLKAKLEAMESYQAVMKACNAIIRNKKLSHEDKLGKLREHNIQDGLAQQLLNGDFCGRLGFPTYKLTNNNANMTTVRKRIKALEATASLEAKEQWFGDIRIFTNTAENRLQIFFPGKPEEDVRKRLKRHGFVWSPSQQAWQRKLSSNAFFSARLLLDAIKKE
ncbi:DUF3560 domain-containing protein [Parachryseolinea silvisoli]|uniref:DUF3560 domain-containing protein n=1 Tax=Parachryseolinea silvisoli TaxID=2873601 RepID=UPI002265B064|nr:DUF3560 domain-containing protein [Parachryseolinea silvisoli]MCD9015215.1 DUF3560 domain-containing protein [Parachryseolinea silvisoli]